MKSVELQETFKELMDEIDWFFDPLNSITMRHYESTDEEITKPGYVLKWADGMFLTIDLTFMHTYYEISLRFEIDLLDRNFEEFWNQLLYTPLKTKHTLKKYYTETTCTETFRDVLYTFEKLCKELSI